MSAACATRQERRGRLWRRHTALEAEGGAVPHLLGPRVYHSPPRRTLACLPGCIPARDKVARLWYRWTRRQAGRRARAHRRRRRRAARPNLPPGARHTTPRPLASHRALCTKPSHRTSFGRGSRCRRRAPRLISAIRGHLPTLSLSTLTNASASPRPAAPRARAEGSSPHSAPSTAAPSRRGRCLAQTWRACAAPPSPSPPPPT